MTSTDVPFLEQRVAELEAQLVNATAAARRDRNAILAEISELQSAVDQILDQAVTTATSSAPGDASPLSGWADRATTEDWRALAKWVDWFTATYDVNPSRIVPTCWPAHGGAVEELAALRDAWVAARKEDPGQAMIYWHDRWLAPCLLRLESSYQLKNCRDGHTKPLPGRPTDNEHVPNVTT